LAARNDACGAKFAIAKVDEAASPQRKQGLARAAGYAPTSQFWGFKNSSNSASREPPSG